MVESMRELLLTWGIDQDAIRAERFEGYD